METPRPETGFLETRQILLVLSDRSDIGEYSCEVVFNPGTLEEYRTSKIVVVKGS